MARTFCSGFEVNDTASGLVDLLTGAGATFDSAIFRSGLYSAKIVPASTVQTYVTALGAGTSGYLRFYVRVTVRPASTARLICGAILASTINLRLNPDGTIAHYLNTTLTGTSTSALTDTTHWYRIEIRTPNGSSVPVLLIDGVTEVTGSPSGWTFAARLGASDSVADTYTAYFDDVSVDGANFPGESRIVLLKPISDNARATLWTGGTGGTTNLFDAVDNTPPAGTATETNTTQIEHAGGAAGSTDAYDANMTSYSTAGLSPSDTVNAIRFFIIHGEDSGTGTKLLNFSLVSNPAQATTLANFAAGADAGALGTYPTTWTATVNGIVTSPSVTVGTSPVMRVVRPETASRVASVCFMGMYVDYTEHRSPPFSRRHRNMIIR